MDYPRIIPTKDYPEVPLHPARLHQLRTGGEVSSQN